MSRLSNAAQLWRSAIAMLGAFASFAGVRGLRALALVGAGAALDGASVLLLVPILGVVVDSRSSFVSAILARWGVVTAIQQLCVLLAVFVVLSIVRAACQYARDVALARLQADFVEAERNRIMHALSHAPWSRVVALSHSRVTNILTTEIARLSSASHFLIQGTVALALLMIQSTVAFSLSPALAGAALGLLLIGLAVFLFSQTRVRDLGAGLVRSSQAMMASASGLLSGLKTATAQNSQALFVAEFQAIQRDVRAGQLGFQKRQARGKLVFSLVSGLLAAAVVLLGFGWLAVPSAVLITLVLVFARMSAPAMTLYQSGQSFVFGLPSFESVRALESELRNAGGDAPRPVPPPPGPIELDGAGFVHPGGRGVRAATLSIAPGEFVGIAGPSGAGKTTLVDLIVGLLSPQSGEVRVGGVALDPARRAGWAQSIAYLPQEGFLFHDTVRRNLTWSSPGASDADIARALAMAGADIVVARMPQGLDTLVGERGALLSGGERQRIALARAMLRQPRLLVLDEAANAIDAEGEAELLDRIRALAPRPTILMISHRESSLGWCDRVIRVDEGVVSA